MMIRSPRAAALVVAAIIPLTAGVAIGRHRTVAIDPALDDARHQALLHPGCTTWAEVNEDMPGNYEVLMLCP